MSSGMSRMSRVWCGVVWCGVVWCSVVEERTGEE